jgi:C4-dicarboxylate transporter DctM subunit
MAVGVAFGLMGAFFMMGLYVAGALGVLSLVLMYFFSDAPLWNILGNKAWETNTNFILVAVPLFILMGELMLRSGLGERMYEALSRWLSPLPGGLIHTNIASCAMFAACSGSSVATSATISRVSLPSFRARGYDERLVLGSLAAGGTLGILIPPSISLIIYGVLVEESIGRLYLAGLFPGLLLAGVFMLMIAATTLVFPRIAPREHMAPLRLRLIGLLSLLPVFGIIFIVLGTIYTGIATPTEAAAFGVTGALVLALLNNSGPVVRGLAVVALKKSGAAALLPGSLGSRIETMDAARLTHTQTLKDTAQANLKMLQDVMLSTVRTSAMIMLIVAAAFTLSFAFARLGIAHNISGWVAGLNLNPVILVIILVVFYIVLGTFMESLSMMVTTVPILAPVLIATGVDLVWFGVIMVILVEAALISPPEGINLYVLHGIRQDVDAEMSAAQGVAVGRGTIGDVWLGVLPFMVCMAIVIGLIIAFPEIALWLPDQLKGVR